ncbi:MAG TPA: bifunctional transaldolase/phosoglucose isomerase [Gemmatimonadales bacterium]|nr:bifunctional transaldolase/phosoglucose isomerase [Gemmatimonadales bacterium]
MGPIEKLLQLGQSVWLDTIDRDLLTSGALKRLVDEEGVRGVTTNPTIFEQALRHGSAYDASVASLAATELDAAALFETLEVADVAAAADVLRPVYEASGGADGFVSIEVSPIRAFDTAGTIAEARRLWYRVDRPNVMVKVPGTKEGLPAIEQLIADGVNVNITLLFAVAMYQRVIEAYFAGLERRVRAHEPLETVHSVASFFVSRVDTEADKRLLAAAQAAADPAARSRIEGLLAKAAIANAKLAYQAHLAAVGTPRWKALAAKGATVQRPLWASTSTKNPKYPDTMYVDELIGPDTVNTLPLATLRAFADHGKAERTIDRDVEGARRVIAEIEAAGVRLNDVTDFLVVDGVKKFSDSYHALLAALEAKRDRLLAERPAHSSRRLLAFDAEVDALLARDGARVVRALMARDPGLWSQDEAERKEIAERLGWLGLPAAMAPRVGEIQAFAEQVRAAGFTRVVLLGMGGSSLAPETIAKVFGPRPGWPTLTVLDSTDPTRIAAVERGAPLATTFFLVSSKSGTTLETSDLFEYFWQRTGGGAGGQFAAITDPGTPLAALAAERKLRRVFENPPDVGGRYSALSYFGLVPAALVGVDVAGVLGRARAMAEACAEAETVAANPGARLAAAFAAGFGAGRDKVTIVTSPELASFGAWAEQLLAESTGKRGRGLVPVAGEPLGAPAAYGNDRLFVALGLEGASDAGAQPLAALEAAGHPVVRLALKDRLDLGAEFQRWEVATALAGAWLGINPFDQPNVAESKQNTDRVLRQLVEGQHPSVPAAVEPGQLGEALAAWAAGIARGDYVALLAYLPPSPEHDAALAAMRVALRDALGVATTAAYGPRYLHSTGQLHKGGTARAAFLALEADGGPQLSVPGTDYAFGTLELAQELGDLIALERRGRRVLRVRLGSGGLDEVRKALEQALKART